MENVRSYSWAQAEIFIKLPQWCEEMNEGSGQMRCGWYVHVPRVNASPRLPYHTPKSWGYAMQLRTLVGRTGGKQHMTVLQWKLCKWLSSKIRGGRDPLWRQRSSKTQRRRRWSNSCCIAMVTVLWEGKGLREQNEASTDVGASTYSKWYSFLSIK